MKNDSGVAKSLDKIAKALENNKTDNEIRIQWAGKLQDAANLVLGATVLSQVLSKSVNAPIGFAGLVLFVLGHWLAYVIMNK